MSRSVLFFLFVSTLFVFECARADRMEEPPIVRINGYLSMYIQAANTLAANIEKHGGKVVKNGADIQIEIPGNSDVLEKIVKLYDNAKESGWVHDMCENGIPGKGFGILLNYDRKLIRTISLCGI